jgi:protein FAM32A
MTKSVFIGGSLAFKGDSKKKSKKKKPKSSKHKLDPNTREIVEKKRKGDEVKSSSRGQVDDDESTEDMTEAERRALNKRLERQRKENEAIARKSHRERVEELNAHLGSLTELNDIPRVSAAGNG